MNKEQLESIQQDYLDGNYLDVIFTTEDLLKVDSSDPNLWNLKGISEFALNDFEAAISSFKSGIEGNPKKEGIRNNLAKVYFKINDIRSALTVYEELVRIDPSNIEYSLVCAECYLKIGNHSKALGYLNICKKISPNDEKVLLAESACLTQMGKFEDSININKNLIKINPKNYNAINNLATNYISLKEFDKALGIFNKYLDNNHSIFEVYNNLGIIYESLNDLNKAEENYRKAMSIKADNIEVNYNLGNILIATQREREALIYLAKGGYRGRVKAPEILYNIEDIDGFRGYIERIKVKIPFDRRIAAISNFYSEQYDDVNPYPWCPDPIKLLHKTNISKALSTELFDYKKIILETNVLDEQFEPQDMTTTNGFQTTGNLFNLDSSNVKILKEVILNEVENYKIINQNIDIPFIKNWPKDFFINGWRVRLLKQGKQEFHIHGKAWCSGVFYLNIPRNLKINEGAIEFGLYGFDYRLKKNKTVTELYMPSMGDLVLFPSALFHRTIPFDSNDERVCIAFDIIPK